MATGLMKATEDTCVWHRLAGRSPRGMLGYHWCLVHQDILIGGVKGGEDLEPRLGCEEEWGQITCPRRVASAGLLVVAMSATLATIEGMLVAILPLWVGYPGYLGQEKNSEAGLRWVP
ncbi:unnamed protein product [Prunus armeniaca]